MGPDISSTVPQPNNNSAGNDFWGFLTDIGKELLKSPAGQDATKTAVNKLTGKKEVAPPKTGGWDGSENRGDYSTMLKWGIGILILGKILNLW